MSTQRHYIFRDLIRFQVKKYNLHAIKILKTISFGDNNFFFFWNLNLINYKVYNLSYTTKTDKEKPNRFSDHQITGPGTKYARSSIFVYLQNN